MKNPKITLYTQYIQKLCKRFHKIEFRHTPRTQNDLDDSLSTIASMIKHLDTNYIDPLDRADRSLFHVEVEPDDLP